MKSINDSGGNTAVLIFEQATCEAQFLLSLPVKRGKLEPRIYRDEDKTVALLRHVKYCLTQHKICSQSLVLSET